MTTRRLVWFAVVGASLCALACAYGDGSGPSAAALERSITVQFQDCTLKEILDDWLGDSYSLDPAALGTRRVTLSLQDTPFKTALRTVANAARVSCARTDQGGWQFRDMARVTLEVSNASLIEALRIAFRNSGYAYLLGAPSLGDRKVTLRLQDVPFDMAVGLIASAAGLSCRQTEDWFWEFRDASATVTLDGKRVPIVGAVRTQDLDTSIRSVTGEQFTVKDPDGQRIFTIPGPAERLHCPLPGIQNEVITFAVDNLPLREAMAKLQAQTGHDVYVPQAVPTAVKLTAKVYLVPVQDFLADVADRAGLSLGITVVDAANRPAPWGPQPKPVRIIAAPGVMIPETMPEPDPHYHPGLHYRFLLVPTSTLHVAKAGSAVQTADLPAARPLFSENPVDLEVTGAAFSEVIARLTTASGYDIVLPKGVGSDVTITAKVYAYPAHELLTRLTAAAGLEVREQWVFDSTGATIPRDADPVTLQQDEAKERVHRRYTLVPKSEIKVTGPGVPARLGMRAPVMPRLRSLPTPIAPEGGVPPLSEPPTPSVEVTEGK